MALGVQYLSLVHRQLSTEVHPLDAAYGPHPLIGGVVYVLHLVCGGISGLF